MTDLLFDARHIRQSGIGTYIRTQLPFLEEVTARHGLNLTVLADDDTAPELAASTTLLRAQPQNAAMYTPAEQKVWLHALNECRPRAMWLPHYPFPLARLAPRHRGVLTYLTVHDTIHVLPEAISGQGLARRMYARAMLSADARWSTRIVTVSEATRALLPRSASVVVTPIPVDEVWFTPPEQSPLPVTGPFMLYVGNTKRHKNLPLLLEAFARVSGEVPHTVVVAGGGASLRTMDDRVRHLAESFGDRVVVTGQVDFAVLRALVASADMLVMPSLYEGAGLPPVEAMAAGTPVLSSSIPALRETCGDGAEFFDPHDVDGLAQLLRRYCLDATARHELAARGRAHVVARQRSIDATAAAETICADLMR
ncbi:glycosyltransferase family 1 protein [Mycobacterium sp. PSTR-4-N]|uniref:glycosyltransferase family 4 protein n=1 Tax=Mycobacterium sp. PSTR-4-N TaxID=2917745 RepID=UPI001F154019|nr:glycosyltransferase family 1 protein [Mycobacterium sp. PSTR-4-N]MCG7592764.1 glycosyltransferase family 4 protein [Mycobacterium sp. PSTR-4-N]